MPKERMLQYFDRNGLTPRPQQVEILQSIADNLHKTYHIVDAPTGVGKSLIALALAELGSTFVLTSSKQLQDQYLRSPQAPVDLRGKGNYECGINRLLTAQDAPCNSVKGMKFLCKSRGCCPYINQRDAALASRAMLTNYAYYLYARLCGPLSPMSPSGPQVRDWLVCDEAHSFEHHLVNFAEIVLDPMELMELVDQLAGWKFTGHKTHDLQVVDEIRSTMQQEYDRLKLLVDSIYAKAGCTNPNDPNQVKNVSPSVIKKVKPHVQQMDKIDKHLRRIQVWHETKEQTEWLVYFKEPCLHITPLHAGGIFDRMVRGSAQRYLFMSATIGDPKEFAEELGLPIKECNFISVKDSFDPERAPIIPCGTCSMNYREVDANLPLIMKTVQKAMSLHPEDKGIIHTANYKIADYIYDHAPRDMRLRLLHRKQGGAKYTKNTDLLNQHQNMDWIPTVLLSPSMNAGVSLDDDLARFQVIVKLPFLSLGDPRTKEKAERRKSWYVNAMWKEFMQASGRGMRSEDDFCVTYVLDDSFLVFFDKATNLPEWFRERIMR